MPSSLSSFKQAQRGFTVTELIIVLAMIAVIAGFAVVSIVRGSRAAYSTNTAVEIAGYLQRARVDSMRRGASDVNQMAQVKIFNHKFYSIAIDGDGDGNLDVPLVKSLPEQIDVEISGPFPKTYLFDSQGQTVDLQNNRVTPPSIILGNSSRACAIRFGDNGKVTVVPGVKMQSTR